MPVSTGSIIRRLTTLLVVAGWTTAAAQTSVGKLPPGTVNTADQTNEQPAPASAVGQHRYGGPDTRQESGAIVINGRKALTQRLVTEVKGIAELLHTAERIAQLGRLSGYL